MTKVRVDGGGSMRGTFVGIKGSRKILTRGDRGRGCEDRGLGMAALTTEHRGSVSGSECGGGSHSRVAGQEGVGRPPDRLCSVGRHVRPARDDRDSVGDRLEGVKGSGQTTGKSLPVMRGRRRLSYAVPRALS
jgi:hypothetical protein